MQHSPESHGSALVGVIGSWIVYWSSLAVKAMPLLQALSLIAATVASICGAIYYIRGARDRRRRK